jgi:hypothetical protein
MVNKNKKKGKSRAPRRIQAPGEIVYRGSLDIPLATSTTASAVTLDSLVTAGTAAFLRGVGDCFQLYRFEDLKLTFYPFANGATSDISAVGYQDEFEDTAPTSVSQLLDYPWSQVMTNSQTTPISLRVPKRVLIGDNQDKFWRTQMPSQTNTGSGTFATSNLWESVQGVFWFLSSTALTINAVLKYAIRLASPAASSLTPRIRTESLLGWNHQSLVRNESFCGFVLFPKIPKKNKNEQAINSPKFCSGCGSALHVHGQACVHCGTCPPPQFLLCAAPLPKPGDRGL